MDQLIPIPAPNVIGKIVQNEAVLVLPETGKVQVLNDVGSFIWSKIDGLRTVEEIVRAVCVEYQVQEETAYSDTASFLNLLVQKKVICLMEKPA